MIFSKKIRKALMEIFLIIFSRIISFCSKSYSTKKLTKPSIFVNNEFYIKFTLKLDSKQHWKDCYWKIYIKTLTKCKMNYDIHMNCFLVQFNFITLSFEMIKWILNYVLKILSMRIMNHKSWIKNLLTMNKNDYNIVLLC